MKSRSTNLFIFILIVSLAILAAVFVVPKEIANKYLPVFPDHAILGNYLPWKLGLDLVGGTALVYEIDLSGTNPADYEDIVSSLVKVIEKRINPLGVLEPKVEAARKGDKYQLLVELAGVKELKDAAKFIGETPTLDFREFKEIKGENGAESDVALVPTELTGRYIKNAALVFDQSNRPVVTFELDDKGAALFEAITERNTGLPLCIFVDNNLIYSDPVTGEDTGGSCPRVNGKIVGGKAEISGGNMTLDSAKQLIGRFKDGALSAPLKLVNQRIVSATIAENSLNQILFAGLVGTAAVMVFMLINYGLFGLFANIALLIYSLLALAIFKSLSITMTLAGIAGFILSIGMAVDANILIFERTKEELKKGLSKGSAIEEGFKRAWLSIRDSNMSTMLTSVILFYFTSSFIKGFALTLLIGVLLSMFSAIFVTRILLKLFIRK